MSEWMNMSEWLEPKLVVLMVFIGTVLVLSRLGGGQPPERTGNRQSRIAAIIRSGRQ